MAAQSSASTKRPRSAVIPDQLEPNQHTTDFNGVVVVQNYLYRIRRQEWARQFREAAKEKDDAALLKMMSNYGEVVVTALGSEVDRLEKEIQELVPGIWHVDIEAHNPIELTM